MLVEGTFTGTDLLVEFSVSRNGEAAQTINTTIDTVADAGIVDGTLSGIGQRLKSDTASEYDTLVVDVVPEPSSLALLALGGLALARRRR